MELLKKIKVNFYKWVDQFLEPNGQAKSVHTQMLDFKVEKLNAAWNAAFNTSARKNRLAVSTASNRHMGLYPLKV